MAKINKGEAKRVLTDAFYENHANINEDDAAHLIVAAEQKIREIKDLQRNDEKLTAAKQIVADLNAAYKSSVAYEQQKIEFLLEKIQEIQAGQVNPTSGANQN